jgi:hypothetical protein
MKPDSSWVDVVPRVRSAAEALHDHQKQRIRVGNQLQAMTTPQGRKTGQGFFGKGLRKTDPVVIQKAAILEFLKNEEKEFVKILRERMKTHPLMPWIKATPGVNYLGLGRLLGIIGDPAWHAVHDRPRRLGELNRYCGMDVIDGAAPRRTKGVQGDNNPQARTRLVVAADAATKQRCQYCKEDAQLVRLEMGLGDGEARPWSPPPSECICAKKFPYRALYDEVRVQLMDSELTRKHQENRARRRVAKAILKDLWIEARRIDGISDSL